MVWRFLRYRRSQKAYLSGYASVRSTTSDERDVISLLEHPTATKASCPGRRAKIIAWWRFLLPCGSWRSKESSSSGKKQGSSIATSPSSRLKTPEKLDSQSDDAGPTDQPMYYIINEVGSVTMRQERNRAHVQSPSIGIPEKRGRRDGLRRSLASCFERHRHAAPCTEPSTDQLDTQRNHVGSRGGRFSSSSTTSLSEDMPPPILRSLSFDYPSPVERASGIVPGDVKFLEEAESCAIGGENEISAARRFTHMSVIPLLPFRDRLASPHHQSNPATEEHPSTLGIKTAHPRWIEREKTNIWDEVRSDSSFLEDLGTRPSPIQVETWTTNGWSDDMSFASSIDSVTTGYANTSTAENTEYQLFPMTQTITRPLSPLCCITKLYQPILQETEDDPVCGPSGEGTFEYAPFDEVKHDFSCAPLGVIDNHQGVRKKTVLHPLKPCPRDSLSYAILPQRARLSCNLRGEV